MAQSKDEWAEVVERDELLWLYAGRMHNGVLPNGRRYVGHFRPDGTGTLIVGQQRIPRVWVIEGRQVCVTSSANDRSCYTFKRHMFRRNEFMANLVGQPGYTVHIVVEDAARRD